MHYRRDKILAQGIYGQVFQGKICPTGNLTAQKLIRTESTTIAIKVMKSETVYDRELLWYRVFFQQKNRALKYIGLVYGYDTIQKSLILELGVSLKDWLKQNLNPNPTIWLDQLMQGLKFIHEMGVLHMDIKLDNILICRGQVKYIDFGLTQVRGQYFELAKNIYPLSYRAPEVLHHQISNPETKLQVKRSVDYWALGIVSYILFYNQNPYSHSSKEIQIRYNSYQKVKLEPSTHPSILSMLSLNPIKRIQVFKLNEYNTYEDNMEYKLNLSKEDHLWFKNFLKSKSIYTKIRYIDAIWYVNCIYSKIEQLDIRILLLSAAIIVSCISSVPMIPIRLFSTDEISLIRKYKQMFFLALGSDLYTESLFRYLQLQSRKNNQSLSSLCQFLPEVLTVGHKSKAEIYQKLVGQFQKV